MQNNNGYLLVLGEELVVWLSNKKLFKDSFEERFEGLSPYARLVLLDALEYLKSKGKIDSDLSYYRRSAEYHPDQPDEKLTMLFSFGSWDDLMPLVNEFIQARLDNDFDVEDDPKQEVSR